jgi:hypothetical protein
MHFTTIIFTFFSLIALTLGMPIIGNRLELNETAIFSSKAKPPVHGRAISWYPGCGRMDWCQVASYQEPDNPNMLLALLDPNCIEIGANNFVKDLGKGEKFAFYSQLPYVTDVYTKKYHGGDYTWPQLSYAGHTYGLRSAPWPYKPRGTSWGGKGQAWWIPFKC